MPSWYDSIWFTLYCFWESVNNWSWEESWTVICMIRLNGMDMPEARTSTARCIIYYSVIGTRPPNIPSEDEGLVNERNKWLIIENIWCALSRKRGLDLWYCRYDLEMHMVHSSSQGEFAVIAILYVLGHPDPFLDKVSEEGLESSSFQIMITFFFRYLYIFMIQLWIFNFFWNRYSMIILDSVWLSL